MIEKNTMKWKGELFNAALLTLFKLFFCVGRIQIVRLLDDKLSKLYAMKAQKKNLSQNSFETWILFIPFMADKRTTA